MIGWSGIELDIAAQLSLLSPERRHYLLARLATHLDIIGEKTRLLHLLSTFDYMQAKINDFGIQALITDYTLLDEFGINAIRDTLQLASHILAVDPTQLWTQLYNRTAHLTYIPVRQLLQRWPNNFWLRTMLPSLPQPGTSLVRTIPTGHRDELRAIALDASGHFAITASADETFKVWDLDEPRMVASVASQYGAIESVTCTPDHQRVVIGTARGFLAVWSFTIGQIITSWQGHGGAITDVAISADGQYIVSGGADHCLIVWKYTGKTFHQYLLLPAHGVDKIAITTNALWIVTAYEQIISVWNLETGRVEQELSNHTGHIAGVAITQDGSRMVSVGWDATLRLWDLSKGIELMCIALRPGYTIGFAMNANGTRAVTAAFDKLIEVWNLESGNQRSCSTRWG